MRKIVVLVLCICLCTFSGIGTADYSESISDPMGDVSSGANIHNNERPDIDITQITLTESEGVVTVTMSVKGVIREDTILISYTLRIVDENRQGYTIDNTGGNCFITWIPGDATDPYYDQPVIPLSSSGVGTHTLTIHFDLNTIGNPKQVRFEGSGGWFRKGGGVSEAGQTREHAGNATYVDGVYANWLAPEKQVPVIVFVVAAIIIISSILILGVYVPWRISKREKGDNIGIRDKIIVLSQKLLLNYITQ